MGVDKRACMGPCTRLHNLLSLTTTKPLASRLRQESVERTGERKVKSTDRRTRYGVLRSVCAVCLERDMSCVLRIPLQTEIQDAGIYPIGRCG